MAEHERYAAVAWFSTVNLRTRNTLKIRALTKTISYWRSEYPASYSRLQNAGLDWGYTELTITSTDTGNKKLSITDPVTNPVGAETAELQALLQNFLVDYRENLLDLLISRSPSLDES